MKKQFHFTDVLGVITKTTLRPEGFKGIGALLCFMTHQNLDEQNYGPAQVDCLPELIKQFPQFNPCTEEMKKALSELTSSPPKNLTERDIFVKKWLEKFKNGEFGIKCEEFLEVAPLSCSPNDVGIFYVDGFRGQGY